MAGVEENEELNDLLQCPVCYEIPKSSPIRQCDRGHHICEPCFNKITEGRCPICKASYYGTRNFIAEDLIKIFPNLKIIPTQTTPKLKTSTEATDEQVYLAPPLSRGHFPCLFSFCKRNFGAGRMLQHIRDFHRASLIEVQARNNYSEAWDFEYRLNMTYVNAIRISNMGIFFFFLQIDAEGIVYATVQMVAAEEVASLFKFKIRILDINNETKMAFRDRVFSCRDTLDDLVNNGHCLIFDTDRFSYLKRDGFLACSLSIIDARK